MLVSLYLNTPFLQKMTISFKEKDYKNLILITLIIPSLLSLFSHFTNISISQYFLLTIFSIEIGYYVAGRYLSMIELSSKKVELAWITLILNCIFMGLTMYIPYVLDKKISFSFDSYSNIFVILTSLSLFYIIRYYFENKQFKEKTKKYIKNISSCTFGIYLIHFIVNNEFYEILYKFGLYDSIPCIATWLVILLTFISSFIFIYIIRKIPFIKKFL